VRILTELWAKFAEVRILKGLATVGDDRLFVKGLRRTLGMDYLWWPGSGEKGESIGKEKLIPHFVRDDTWGEGRRMLKHQGGGEMRGPSEKGRCCDSQGMVALKLLFVNTHFMCTACSFERGGGFEWEWRKSRGLRELGGE
jgi:hypothetical protein